MAIIIDLLAIMAFKSPMAPKNICIKFALTTVESNWNNNFVINVRQSQPASWSAGQPCATNPSNRPRPLPTQATNNSSSSWRPPANVNWKRAYRRASAGWPEPEPEPEPGPGPGPELEPRAEQPEPGLQCGYRLAELHLNAISRTLQLFNAFNYICWLALNVFIINRINIDIGPGSVDPKFELNPNPNPIHPPLLPEDQTVAVNCRLKM